MREDCIYITFLNVMVERCPPASVGNCQLCGIEWSGQGPTQVTRFVHSSNVETIEISANNHTLGYLTHPLPSL